MQINFSTLVKDQNGDLPQRPKTEDGKVVRDDDEKPVMEDQKVEISDHIMNFLNRAVQDSDNLKEINALRGIMSDIARGKEEYSEEDITLIKEKIDEQLPLPDDRKKAPIVLTSITKLLDI